MSAIDIGKLGLGVAGATAVMALIAGCASSSSSAKTAAGGASSGLKSKSTSIGTVLVDSAGHTVYELVGDSAANQTCTGACLTAWPAVQTNGKQMVVNGHPAFTYVKDKSAGQTSGQDLTDQWGLWLALDPSGNPINTPAGSSKAPATQAPTTKAKAPGGGGPAF